MKDRDCLIRVNYLLQAAYQVISSQPNNTELVRYYTKCIIEIQMRKRLNMSDDIKRSICKSCYMLLVPGVSCRVRMKNEPVSKKKKKKTKSPACEKDEDMESEQENQVQEPANQPANRPDNSKRARKKKKQPGSLRKRKFVSSTCLSCSEVTKYPTEFQRKSKSKSKKDKKPAGGKSGQSDKPITSDGPMEVDVCM